MLYIMDLTMRFPVVQAGHFIVRSSSVIGTGSHVEIDILRVTIDTSVIGSKADMSLNQ
jgi:hypothetical protein